MRVLHVIPSLSPARGGPSFALRRMACGLAARGITVHIAVTDDDGPHAHLPVAHGVGIADSGATCFYFRRQTRFYSFSWPLTTWLCRHIRDYDVVHVHALFSYPASIAAWLSRRARVPYVLRPLGTLAQWGLTTRRPWVKRWSLALVERPLLRAAAFVHATSNDERTEILAACPESCVTVIPNPVDVPKAPVERPETSQPSVILYLSRLDPKKGLEYLLHAFDTVAASHPELRLLIAGDGAPAYAASLRQLAASLPARDRIRFLGNVDAGHKRSLFAEADLFVLPSYSENFGIAVVEAMAHGVPVLISPFVGIHGEVTAVSAGRIADCNAESVARVLDEMLAQPEELRNMGANGRKLASMKYSAKNISRQLHAIYLEMMASNAREARSV